MEVPFVVKLAGYQAACTFLRIGVSRVFLVFGMAC